MYEPSAIAGLVVTAVLTAGLYALMSYGLALVYGVMKIINLDDVWVTANFKETQLRQMKIGQRVTIDVDANGRTYNGTVDSIAGASGARFSLLPPENATGNYVKVVQRIPVKIVLNPGENDGSLRPGMSVTPKVWIRQ